MGRRVYNLLNMRLLEQVMLVCGKYNLVYDFFKKVQKLYIPNALIFKGNFLKYPHSLLHHRSLLVNRFLVVCSSHKCSLEGRQSR